MGALVLILLFGIALIAAPIAADVAKVELDATSFVIMTSSGILLSLLSAILLIITRLYQKPKANEALVRTGMGGMKVIKDGGSIVIPVVHEVVRVPLESLRLQMKREGAAGLITGDKLRADVNAEFYVRVMPNDDDIMNAARSLGEKLHTPSEVAKLVEDKLVSALRNVAAKRTLEQLNSDRDSFVGEVMKIVAGDLQHNGLNLESVTISKLDQTDPAQLKDNNIFDAQGKRTIAEIVQRQLTERNALEKEGEQARAKKDVETRQQILMLDQAKAKAEAEQAAAIAQINAEQDRLAKEKEIATARAVALADVHRTQAIEIATREKEAATGVAERKKQESIAKAEAERAAAEAALARAEAEREKERQAVTTVTVTAEAEREKQKKVINAEAEAQQSFVRAQREADAKAYGVQKDADARKAAADADAEATIKKADADSTAARRRAEGQQAEAMVPVEVKKAEVNIEQRRVDVLRQEMQARTEFGEAAQNFEITQLRINKEAEVRIEAARAVAHLVGQVEATVVGTPEDVARMTQGYMKGFGFARLLDGFVNGAEGPVLDSANAAGGQMLNLLSGIAQKLGIAPELLVKGKPGAAATVPPGHVSLLERAEPGKEAPALQTRATQKEE